MIVGERSVGRRLDRGRSRGADADRLILALAQRAADIGQRGMKRGVGIFAPAPVGARRRARCATPRDWPRKSSIRATISPGPASARRRRPRSAARRTAARRATAATGSGSSSSSARASTAPRAAGHPRSATRPSADSATVDDRRRGTRPAIDARDQPRRRQARRSAPATPAAIQPRAERREQRHGEARPRRQAQAQRSRRRRFRSPAGKLSSSWPATVADKRESPLNSPRSRRSARR